MFIRFVVTRVDEDSHQLAGVFQPAYELRDSIEVADYDRERIAEILRWFDNNLEQPARFSRSRRAYEPGIAISWYKDSASQQISKMRELSSILAEYGHGLEELTTERPGKVVWEDDIQIVAEPFKDTFR